MDDIQKNFDVMNLANLKLNDKENYTVDDQIIQEIEAKNLFKFQESLKKRAEELSVIESNLMIKSAELEQKENQLLTKQQIVNDHEKNLINEQDKLNLLKLELVVKEREIEAQKYSQAQQQEQIENEFSLEREKLKHELQEIKIEALNKQNLFLMQERDNKLEQLERELQQKYNDIDAQRAKLNDDLVQLKIEQDILLFNQKEVEQMKSSLEQRVEGLMQTRKKEYENAERLFEQEKNRLLNRIDTLNTVNGLYNELEKAFKGKAPETVLIEFTAQNEELAKLRNELLQPSKDIEMYYDEHQRQITKLQEEKEILFNKCQEMHEILDKQEQKEYDFDKLQRQHKSLTIELDAVLADNNKLLETLERLKPAYNEPKNREDRIKEIKRPYIKSYIPRRELNVKEMPWLDEIHKGISSHGLQFSYRILCAFHTALKIAEWSPLTVLAGVSGTGKSELPKLYSAFGGINFINVPVQPNWDSQESMLGYFNSISNSYEAQPLLNFLVQSRENLVVGSDNHENNYHGLNDTLSLVLLDEMNLAHVELYFADFLSKLEQRRGTSKDNLPEIEINLGAKLEPYKLTLGRNILFAGTMNQDETTKSLSDKVIDRGTSIFFPRPNTLHRREKLEILKAESSLLSNKNWRSWIAMASNLSETVINKYKTIIEEINECLGKDSRALGHRVWQSIEYYMVNHPLVVSLDVSKYPDEYSEALKFAFEDQLVQKVMPKLRGIETRGFAKDHCLNPIRDILANNKLDILEDYDKAMRVGHGQFTWTSADYLNNEQNNLRYEELFALALKASDEKSTIKHINNGA